MKSYPLPIHSSKFYVLAILFFTLLVPFTTNAESIKPTCELHVQTQAGVTSIKNKKDVLLHKGDTLQITWKSKNATQAFIGKKSITLSGVSFVTPSTTTIYSYRFNNGNAKAVCSVTVHIVTGEFATSSLQTLSTKPTISGTASGTKKVHIKILKVGSTTPLFTSKSIPVKNGIWKTKLTKKLSKGTYDIVLLGEKGMVHNIISQETLTIGNVPKKVERKTGSVAIIPIPLLTGGIARAGATIALSYLQVINVGKEPVVIHGFTVKQNGSASTDPISQLTITDDSGSFRNTVDGTVVPFKNNTAFIPLEVPFTTGQMRLFTIKAVLSNNVTSYLGTQLKVDIINVDASATIPSAFPIRGTTWTFGV